MIKILRVGDPHVTVSNLKDSQKLMDFVINTAITKKVDRIEFLGDLFHTHAVIRLEVLDFWQKVFDKLAHFKIPTLILVGNHDQPGSREKEQTMNALKVFRNYPYLTIIDKPMFPGGGEIGYIPHMSNHEEFIKACYFLYTESKKCLVAHQTFTGAAYDNGFPAPDGIEPELVPQDEIISGHIHGTQQIGKCFYPGTPKWDIVSDANKEKGIWVFIHNEDGSVLSKEFISTKDVVTSINKYVVYEGEEVPELKDGARNYLEFHGKSAWISKMKKKYKGKAHIKGKPVDRKISKIDRDKSQTIIDYLTNTFEPIDGVHKADIDNYLKDLAV